ncbi:MAG: sensor histidine kinase [Pelosinus sp.]|nr:sensor histidine kinase [Pelosinus sp.]
MLNHVVLLVSIAGMIYIYPFEGYFRFTLSVAILSTLLLYFPKISPLRAAAFSGGFIFALRCTMQYPFGVEPLYHVILHNLPSLAYYVSYGVLFTVLKIRSQVENMPTMLLLLSIADIASNCIEIILHWGLLGRSLEVVLSSIVAVGVLRSILTVYSYFGLRKYSAFVLAEEQALRYAEQTLLIAKLKAELFYLKKSSHDIETVMQKGYTLYQKLTALEPVALNDSQSPAAESLAIARDIHEIKKNYYRVTHGMENILEHSLNNQCMSVSEIFQLVEENTRRLAHSIHKNVHFSFEHSGDLVTDRHFTLVSILDNLLTNAIDAVETGGLISVQSSCSAEKLTLVVSDNGCGIKKEEFALIFAPGYSTKFSEETGELSTGLGLAHVKNLAEILKGTVTLESQPGKTIFTVVIPIDQLAAVHS